MATGQHKDFMARGLQVIALLYRELDTAQLKDFTTKYENAKAGLVGVEEKMEAVIKEFSTDLEYLGTVGIMDKVSSATGKTVKIL
jgi:magnesium-transporting ATPase (P-type)